METTVILKTRDGLLIRPKNPKAFIGDATIKVVHPQTKKYRYYEIVKADGVTFIYEEIDWVETLK